MARIALEPGEISKNHYHTEVVENIVCLRGELEIKFGSSDKAQVLSPGNMFEISPNEAHYLINSSSSVSEYLLIQSGDYDFVPANS